MKCLHSGSIRSCIGVKSLGMIYLSLGLVSLLFKMISHKFVFNLQNSYLAKRTEANISFYETYNTSLNTWQISQPIPLASLIHKSEDPHSQASPLNEKLLQPSCTAVYITEHPSPAATCSGRPASFQPMIKPIVPAKKIAAVLQIINMMER